MRCRKKTPLTGKTVSIPEHRCGPVPPFCDTFYLRLPRPVTTFPTICWPLIPSCAGEPSLLLMKRVRSTGETPCRRTSTEPSFDKLRMTGFDRLRKTGKKSDSVHSAREPGELSKSPRLKFDGNQIFICTYRKGTMRRHFFLENRFLFPQKKTPVHRVNTTTKGVSAL